MSFACKVNYRRETLPASKVALLQCCVFCAIHFFVTFTTWHAMTLCFFCEKTEFSPAVYTELVKYTDGLVEMLRCALHWKGYSIHTRKWHLWAQQQQQTACWCLQLACSHTHSHRRISGLLCTSDAQSLHVAWLITLHTASWQTEDIILPEELLWRISD